MCRSMYFDPGICWIPPLTMHAAVHHFLSSSIQRLGSSWDYQLSRLVFTLQFKAFHYTEVAQGVNLHINCSPEGTLPSARLEQMISDVKRPRCCGYNNGLARRNQRQRPIYVPFIQILIKYNGVFPLNSKLFPNLSQFELVLVAGMNGTFSNCGISSAEAGGKKPVRSHQEDWWGVICRGWLSPRTKYRGVIFFHTHLFVTVGEEANLR